jgi:flagellar biosynthesis/type III secretory pathway M-ring protein FliF/YscJ
VIASISLDDPLTIVLIVAMLVLGATTAAMIVGLTRPERHRRAKQAARLGAMPVVPLITATPRSRRGLPVPARLGPPIDDPARQGSPEEDDRTRRAAQVDDAQALIDQLAASHPERLAEIITQWIHEDDRTRSDPA